MFPQVLALCRTGLYTGAPSILNRYMVFQITAPRFVQVIVVAKMLLPRSLFGDLGKYTEDATRRPWQHLWGFRTGRPPSSQRGPTGDGALIARVCFEPSIGAGGRPKPGFAAPVQGARRKLWTKCQGRGLETLATLLMSPNVGLGNSGHVLKRGIVFRSTIMA